MRSSDIEQACSSFVDWEALKIMGLEYPPPSEHQQPASGCPAQVPLIAQQRAACPSSRQARCHPQPDRAIPSISTCMPHAHGLDACRRDDNAYTRANMHDDAA